MFTQGMSREEVESVLGEKFTEFYTDEHRPPTDYPPQLFHYTDACGLNGITETGHLWASNVRFLNDPGEPAYAHSILKECVESVKNGLAEGSWASRVLDGSWDWFVVAYKNEAVDLYVCCFCEQGDLLSQWRGYGAGGGGYALGLSTKDLLSRLPLEQGRFLTPAIYDPQKQRAIAKACIVKRTDVIVESERVFGPIDTRSPLAPRLQHKLRQTLLAAFIWLQAQFKHPAFQEEKEWRILQFVDRKSHIGSLNFRVSGSRLVPYGELDLRTASARKGDVGDPDLPLQAVVCGPSLHPDSTKQVLELLFMRRGYSGVQVDPSQVPFRA